MRKTLFQSLFILFLFHSAPAAQPAKIEGVHLSGNAEIGDGQLKGVMTTRADSRLSFLFFWEKPEILDEEALLDDLVRIEQLYHRRGFLDARIADYRLEYSNDGEEVNVHIQIEEGEPTLVDSVGSPSSI